MSGCEQVITSRRPALKWPITNSYSRNVNCLLGSFVAGTSKFF